MSDWVDYVKKQNAKEFLESLDDDSIDLLLIDPPYYDIVKDGWDNQWSSKEQYIEWFIDILKIAYCKLGRTSSLLFFGGIGGHDKHPFFELISKIDKELNYTFRNIITWKKRRAYGKSHDYLFCREEIAWYSISNERTEVTFNIPLLSEKRGYAGFNSKYPAKSEFKRVSNVFDDIPELMRPERTAEKPITLMDRLVRTHSNENDLVVDCFSGSGSTGVSALLNKRNFIGCDISDEAVSMSNERMNNLNCETKRLDNTDYIKEELSKKVDSLYEQYKSEKSDSIMQEILNLAKDF